MRMAIKGAKRRGAGDFAQGFAQVKVVHAFAASSSCQARSTA
jgi:hypothetical protein